MLSDDLAGQKADPADVTLTDPVGRERIRRARAEEVVRLGELLVGRQKLCDKARVGAGHPDQVMRPLRRLCDSHQRPASEPLAGGQSAIGNRLWSLGT